MKKLYWLGGSALIAAPVAVFGPWELAVSALVFGFSALIAEARRGT